MRPATMRPIVLTLLCLAAIPAAAQQVPPPHPPITPPPTPPEVIAPRPDSTSPGTGGVIRPPANVDPGIAVRPPPGAGQTPVIQPDNRQKPNAEPSSPTGPKAP